MGKTTYSRNPSTSKGTTSNTQSLNHQLEISEFIIKTLMRLVKPSKALLLPKLNNISKTFLDTEDVFPTQNILEVLVELVKPLNSEKLSEDGPKNPLKSFQDWLTTSNRTLMLKTLKTLPSITFKQIELLRVVEELTEPMVESVLTFLHKLTFKFLLLRKLLT